MFHASHCPGFERFPVHDRGIELIRSRVRKDSAFASVKVQIIF